MNISNFDIFIENNNTSSALSWHDGATSPTGTCDLLSVIFAIDHVHAHEIQISKTFSSLSIATNLLSLLFNSK